LYSHYGNQYGSYIIEAYDALNLVGYKPKGTRSAPYGCNCMWLTAVFFVLLFTTGKIRKHPNYPVKEE
jgi:hypothetical protein